MIDNSMFKVKGHVKIVDDQGSVLLDKNNAIHPQNMARIIARGLANENNSSIYRIAFGNGGTFVNTASTVTYRSVNDGQPPDSKTWDSRLYNETYSEVIDEGNPALNVLLGTDPGSSDAITGTRTGGGAVPSSDPSSVPNVSGPGVKSNELGLTSEVVITCVLNPDEPKGQYQSDILAPTENPESYFMFDEIGLYTAGGPAIATAGVIDIDIGNKTAYDDSGLTANTTYDFRISVDGGLYQTITFTTPVVGGSGVGGEILYGDIVKAILTGDVAWNATWAGVNPLPGGAILNITNDGLFHASVPAAQTYGFLRFFSGSTGSTSSVIVTNSPNPTSLFAPSNINPPTGGTIKTPIAGRSAGIQNDPVAQSNERERLLSHIIFSPILKAANRTITIIYTLTVAVARTVA